MTRPPLSPATRLLGALAAAALFTAGCTPRGEPWTEATLARLSLRARAAQLVVALPGSLRGALADSVGGVWLRAGSAPALPALPRSAPVPLLVAAEVDGGVGALVRGATRFPPLASLAAEDADLAEAVGEQVAREARALGIHLGVVSLPRVDAAPATSLLPIPGEAAADAAAAFVEGLREGGLLPAVRALHPRTAAPRVLRWDRARLEAVELPLVRAAVDEGARVVVLPALSLPALTGDSLPLALSPAAVQGVLRRDLGFGGIVAADLRPGNPLVRRYGQEEAAVRAVAAGADLLLGVSAPERVVGALVGAVRAGRIPPARIEEAARRVLQAKERAGLAEPHASAAPPPLRTRDALKVAHRAAEAVARSRASLRRPPAAVLREVPPESVGISSEALAGADRVIREAIGEGVFPGAALAVGRRGGLVRLRGYGEVDGGSPVSGRETLYDVASLTKVVGTTAAVMALVDEGRLRLDAPVRRYLPEFRGEGKGEVTVQHLLTHTSGLPAGDWLYGLARSPEAALERALEAPILRPPGERMVYSDYGFILLAEVVERVAEEPLDRFLARRVFAPLGMSSTLFLPPRVLRPQTVPTVRESEREYVLWGVVHDANAFRLGGVAGHAGLFSTARDLAVFAQAILNGGSYGTRRVWSPQVVRRFTADHPAPGKRGLGWDLPAARSSAGSYFSSRSFGHTGFTGTSLWIDPEKELFVVLLTNRTYTKATSRQMLEVREALHDAVARAITDTEVRPRPGSPAARSR